MTPAHGPNTTLKKSVKTGFSKLPASYYMIRKPKISIDSTEQSGS